MDKEALKTQLDNEKAAVQAYLDHPFTVQIFADSAEEQEGLVALLCDRTIVGIETFFAHFEAIGHLRGLRRSKALVLDKLADIQQQLKDLEE